MKLRVYRFAFVGLLLLSNCAVRIDPIEQAITAINTSIKTIQAESEAWRNELPQLQTQLKNIAQNVEGQAATDVKTIIDDTSNQVQTLLNDTIKVASLSGQNLVADFGSEIRCNIDFVRSRAVESLQQFVEKLTFWKQYHQLPSPPPHSVCHINPNILELHPRGSDDTWSIGMPPDKIIGIYGYNFRSDALPRLELQDAAGQRLRDAQLTAAYITQYQINLDFSGEDFHQMSAGARFVLQWPDKPDLNTISTVLVQPAILKIVNVIFDPPQPRAEANLVRAKGIVINQGGLDSQAFTINWKPGPNEPVKSLTIQNLSPGQEQSFIFDGYTYPIDGVFETEISLSNGQDSYKNIIVVTPFASIPSQHTVDIGGEWTEGGNEGEKKEFLFNADTIPLHCVLDTTRGGGSTEVADLDHPEIRYPVTWPAGYYFHFDLDERTFFRTILGVDAHTDVQTRKVTGSVTLKGVGYHKLFEGARYGKERFHGKFTVYYKCPPTNQNSSMNQ